MLELITFTGVDENTDLEEVRKIAARYQQAEFAVLAGSQTGGGNPIFPPMDTVRKLRDLEGVRTAVHLCGSHARMAAGEMYTGGRTPPTPSTCSATASAGCRSTCTGTRQTQKGCGCPPSP